MRIPGFLRQHFLLKLVALGCAVVVYWSISQNNSAERMVTVPVNIHLTSDLVMPQPNKRFEVQVLVRGSQREVDNAEIFANVYVTPKHRYEGDVYRIILREQDFRMGRLKIVKLPQEPLILQLQRRISRELPVRIRFSGKPVAGYRVSESAGDPATVTVTGPENEVSQLKDITTEPVPLNDSERGFDYEAELQVPRHLQVSPSRVTVNVAIERSLTNRDFHRMPVGVLSDGAAGVSARFGAPAFAEVRAVGSAADIALLGPNDIRLYVDISNISTPGEYTLPVRSHVGRDGVGIGSISPAHLKVIVSKMPIEK